MRRIVTATEMKQIEQNTINTVGIPSIALMERAAGSVVKHIPTGKMVLVVCGVGNNGADGLAIARMIKLRGNEVRLYIVGDIERATKEFRLQKNICDNLGILTLQERQIEPDIIVDAIFGIGLSREVSGEFYDAIEFINKYKTRVHDNNNKCNVISVDIPSGLCSNTGKELGIAVKADITVTFQYQKLGLIINEGPRYAGEVFVEDIGIADPTDIHSSDDEEVFDVKNIAFTYDESDISLFPERDKLGNKGTFGKVLLVTGSEGMPGASILTARSAFKCGSGMVKVVSSKNNRDLLMHEIPEAMFQAYEDMTVEDLEKELNWCDACLIGPGLAVSDLSKYLVNAVLEKCAKPVILDADGLNIQALSDLEGIRKRGQKKYKTILTPHPAEFARLTHTDVKQKKNYDIEFVSAIARNNFCYIAAKDARTIVTTGSQPVYINTVTSDSLATAGSGDIFAAVITSLIAKNMKTFEAVCLATLLHGMAGKKAAENKGSNAASASDIINAIGDILK